MVTSTRNLVGVYCRGQMGAVQSCLGIVAFYLSGVRIPLLTCLSGSKHARGDATPLYYLLEAYRRGPL